MIEAVTVAPPRNNAQGAIVGGQYAALRRETDWMLLFTGETSEEIMRDFALNVSPWHLAAGANAWTDEARAAGFTHGWAVADDRVINRAPVADTETDPVAALREQVAALETQLADARESNARLDAQVIRVRSALDQARIEHEADIATIGEALIDQADNRSWCPEYDEAVDEVNRHLNRSLPVREREVEVEVTGHVRVPFTYTLTVMRKGGTTDLSDTVDEAVAALSIYELGLDVTDGEIEDDYDYEESD